MREVTREKFFSAIGPLNVHPSPEAYVTYWRHVHTRELFGKSTPGYKCETPEGKYTEEKHYFLPR
jgi:hypothetical protein